MAAQITIQASESVIVIVIGRPARPGTRTLAALLTLLTKDSAGADPVEARPHHHRRLVHCQMTARQRLFLSVVPKALTQTQQPVIALATQARQALDPRLFLW
eukprot:COSAG01_NODE_44361_length_420_cov_0.426791_1_plen_102_part_00